MNSALPMLDGGEVRAALSAALRDADGADARLEAWTTRPVSKRGKHRVVGYDLRARVPRVPEIRFHRWVGKFYERDGEAQTAARILGELGRSCSDAAARWVVPRVVGYWAPQRLLLLTFEPGESLTAAIARSSETVLEALGQALAALHRARVTLDATTSPADVLDGVRARLEELYAAFPARASTLRRVGVELESEAPPQAASQRFLHGDLGAAQLRWRAGEVVLLDFDRCTRGDPALDLGILLTQLRRLTLRKPGKLPVFPSLRSRILAAYGRSAPDDPGLRQRVDWYQRATLLRKIHRLAFDKTRHTEADAIRARQTEAQRLLEYLH